MCEPWEESDEFGTVTFATVQTVRPYRYTVAIMVALVGVPTFIRERHPSLWL